MTSNIRVAVIGGGYFASFHINAWLRIPNVELSAIIENDRSKHKALEESVSTNGSPGTLITDSFSNALQGGAIDIIDIATPPQSHAVLIEEAIKLKCPLIICQKPFCGNLEAAEEILNTIACSDSKVVVHENFRFQPWFRKIKSIIDESTLGDVLQATFRLRPGDGQGESAYLERQPYFRQMDRFLIHETGIHYIDVFRYLFGEPDALSADLRRLNPAIAGEDAGHFIFYYDNGLRAHFDGNRLLDHATENSRLTMGEMLIEGTKGCLSLHGNGDLHLRNFGHADWQTIEYAFDDNDFGGDCVYHLQKHVVDHLQRNTPLENIANDYLNNQRLESLVYTAAQTHGRHSTTSMDIA